MKKQLKQTRLTALLLALLLLAGGCAAPKENAKPGKGTGAESGQDPAAQATYDPQAALEAAEIPEQGDDVVFTFAAMSDTHIGDTNTEESLRRTLRYLNKVGRNKVNAFMFSGDLTNSTGTGSGKIQIPEFKKIFLEEVPYDTTVVYSLGPTHDVPSSGSALSYRKQFREIFGDELLKNDVGTAELAEKGVRHQVINGYHFFSVDWEGENGGALDNSTLSWLRNEIKAAAEEDAGKPFFVSTHVPGQAQIIGLLRNYPQAICFTGHVHNSVSREDSISQGDGYTSIHCGGVNYYRVDGYNRFTDNPYLNLGNIYEFAQAVYVQVHQDNSVTIHRLNTYYPAIIGKTWEVGPGRYDVYTSDRKKEALCAFPDDADLLVEELNGNILKVSFDPAQAGAAGPATYYMISILHKKGKVYRTSKHVELSSQEVFFPNGKDIPDLYYTYTFPDADLSDYAVTVTAYDCWGKSVNDLVYNGGSYKSTRPAGGKTKFVKRDFNEAEKLTGLVTEGEDTVSFTYGAGSDPTRFNSDSYSMAVRFYPTVPFKDVKLRCTSWGDLKGTLTFRLYRWKDSYDATVAGTPVDTFEMSGYRGSTVYTVLRNTYEAGEYLLVVTSPDYKEGVGLYHYPISDGRDNAYISYECGKPMEGTHLYFGWTNTKTCTNPYKPFSKST